MCYCRMRVTGCWCVCDCLVCVTAAGPCCQHSQGSVQRHSAGGQHHSLRLRWNAGCCAWLHLPSLGCESWHPPCLFFTLLSENTSITTAVFSFFDTDFNYLERLLLKQGWGCNTHSFQQLIVIFNRLLQFGVVIHFTKIPIWINLSSAELLWMDVTEYRFINFLLDSLGSYHLLQSVAAATVWSPMNKIENWL